MPRTEERIDLIDLIIQDHRDVEAAFRELEQHTGQSDGRKDLVDHVVAELVRHSVAEEQYMYPAARELLDDGDRIAEHEIREHAEAEELMKRLEGMGPENSDFEQLLDELMKAVRHHVDDDPGVAFVDKIRDALSGREA